MILKELETKGDYAKQHDNTFHVEWYCWEVWNQPGGSRVMAITPLGRIVALLTYLHGKLRMGTILKTCFSVGD